MSFDAVHDTQKAFRLITDCSAFPGKTADLSDLAKGITLDLPFSRGIALLCLTLLDGEVGFYTDDDSAAKRLSELTYSRRTSLEKAHFVLTGEGDPAALMEGAGKGTLVDPHLGATLIMPVDSLTEGVEYELRGPGIESTRRVRISSAHDWLTPLSRANREFPLGVELYLLDREERLMVLPRTTRIGRRD
ncbi:MAG: phosphonate C-P lyase system protein PhnH [Spirochaetales bacterium]|nr:phosphonate C-P lyase system protein PhnH [Spirochaetales bacterium]